MNNRNIGFAITGSFCTHERIIVEIEKLVNDGFNVIPILSDAVVKTDTRFGKAADFIEKLKNITKNEPVVDIVKAEPVGPSNLIDLLVIAPCTGNTLSKLAHAITDNAVTMVTKAHMRNNKPVVIGISTNDALGLNMQSLATLLTTKNIYFVPFGQDAPDKKPKSMIAHWERLKSTIDCAYEGQQLQPIIMDYRR